LGGEAWKKKERLPRERGRGGGGAAAECLRHRRGTQGGKKARARDSGVRLRRGGCLTALSGGSGPSPLQPGYRSKGTGGEKEGVEWREESGEEIPFRVPKKNADGPRKPRSKGEGNGVHGVGLL